MKRNRLLYAFLVPLTIGFGLVSRKTYYLFPDYINLVLGDAIWAIMIYFGVGFFFNKWSIVQVAFASLLFCYAIEVSQFYHAPWIEEIRNNKLGGLVLGFGFLWSDILAYTIGVFIAAFGEFFTNNKNK